MSDLPVYKCKMRYGLIRIVKIDDDYWFTVYGLCSTYGIENADAVIGNIPDDDKRNVVIEETNSDGSAERIEETIINSRGYSMLMNLCHIKFDPLSDDLLLMVGGMSLLTMLFQMLNGKDNEGEK